jgi:hypothetical protein
MDNSNSKLEGTSESQHKNNAMLPAVSDMEYILCAAIWFDDGEQYEHQPKNITTGLVFCGYRHGCIFQQIGGTMGERKQLGIYEKEQGFLTNRNRFVDREEAAKIALQANQIAEPLLRLFSEDLY